MVIQLMNQYTIWTIWDFQKRRSKNTNSQNYEIKYLLKFMRNWKNNKPKWNNECYEMFQFVSLFSEWEVILRFWKKKKICIFVVQQQKHKNFRFWNILKLWDFRFHCLLTSVMKCSKLYRYARPTRHYARPARHYARPVEPVRHYARPVEPARHYARPVEPVRHYARPVEPARHYARPVEPARHYARPVEPVRHYARLARFHLSIQINYATKYPWKFTRNWKNLGKSNIVRWIYSISIFIQYRNSKRQFPMHTTSQILNQFRLKALLRKT